MTTAPLKSRLAARMLVGALLALFAVFWTAQGVSAYLTRRLAAVQANWVKPPLLHGALFGGWPYLPNHATAHNARYLVIVTSDQCRACVQQLPAWKRLVHDVTFANDDVVVIVSLTGSSLANSLTEELKSGPVRHHAIVAPNASEFSALTGISWTPEVLALDSQFRIRRAAWDLNPTVATRFAEFFATSQK